jgi:hypothetical protein
MDNTSRYGTNRSNLDADIKPLGLNAAERADLAQFLKSPLTDPRVAWERAPFDHPSLVVPNGHIGDATQVAGKSSTDPKIAKRAQDALLNVQAVGQSGRAAKDGPLQPFHLQLK